jgi:hypothetical protein
MGISSVTYKEAFENKWNMEDFAELALASIGKWKDPYPKPILQDFKSYYVIRDDLLGFGSKIRFIDYLIGHCPETKNIKEWCFGACPATGYAQISLPFVCERYGKEAHLFMAKRNKENYTEYQKKGIEIGAQYHWIPDGMLPVTKARAREYVEKKPKERMSFPLGLEHITVLGSIIRVARDIFDKTYTGEVWTVGSSGTLNRGLQLAWPKAHLNVVSVGHTMSEYEVGRATYWKSEYKFDKPVKEKDIPPFPSVPTYDAKGWSFVKKYGSPNALFWNVAS